MLVTHSNDDLIALKANHYKHYTSSSVQFSSSSVPIAYFLLIVLFANLGGCSKLTIKYMRSNICYCYNCEQLSI